MDKKIICIDIGGTSIKFAVVSVEGCLLKKWRIPTNLEDSGSYIPTEIVYSVQNETQEFEFADFLGVGVGVPGSVSNDEALVFQAVNLGWSDLPLKRMLEEKLLLPVRVINDANAAALGELWKGVAKGKQSILFVTLGTGVGGGIVIDGKILTGAHSSAGEIGHIPVLSSEKRKCGCGNFNCLETFASATGLVETYRLLRGEIKVSGITAKQIFERSKKDDSIALEAINRLTKHLGIAISGIANSIDIDEVVIGGGLSEAGDQLMIPLINEVDSHLYPNIRLNLKVTKAQLGNDAGIFGAAYHCASYSRKNCLESIK